jgi:hypothetical protein
MEQALHGKGDLEFLKRVFGKLTSNFGWWVNRKDRFGKGLFEGGFLGLDNIGVFDRSAPLPTGGHLEQALRCCAKPLSVPCRRCVEGSANSSPASPQPIA